MSITQDAERPPYLEIKSISPYTRKFKISQAREPGPYLDLIHEMLQLFIIKGFLLGHPILLLSFPNGALFSIPNIVPFSFAPLGTLPSVKI